VPAWTTPIVLSWIERVEAKAKKGTLFELLEVPQSADTAMVSQAFLRVASGAHPDLHRKGLSAADAERLVSAYGKVAAAYDTLRDPKQRDRYKKELGDRTRPVSQPPLIAGSQAVPVQRPVPAAVALAGRGNPTSLGFAGGPAIARTVTPGRSLGTRPPPDGPSVPRTTTPPAIARTTTPPTQPPASRPTTPPPATARTTTPPQRAATSPGAATSSASARGASTVAGRAKTPSPNDARAPVVTPPARASTAPVVDPDAASTSPPPRMPSATVRPRGDSRPPTGGISARAQVYYRKAQSALSQGDLGGALFNLRLAAAADPRSSVIRVALAEVENEIGSKR
jgi:hypothetical protein